MFDLFDFDRDGDIDFTEGALGLMMLKELFSDDDDDDLDFDEEEDDCN